MRVVSAASHHLRRLARCIGALGAAMVIAAPAGAATVASGPRTIFGPSAPTTVTPAANGWVAVSTQPARRANESIGINLDTWSHAGAYSFDRWPGLMKSMTTLGIGRARVDVHLVAGDWGTQRQVEMGRAGMKLDVLLGDAFGRYSAAPLSSVFNVFRSHLLPYAESVEGTNEPDLAGNPNWAAIARTHQQGIVDALAATPGTEHLAVLAPSTGRPKNQSGLGDLTGLADYANAHAYSGGQIGASGYDNFLPPATRVLPGGPLVVTETGVHTSPTGTYSQPGVPESVAARYAPKGLLEAIRRGVPRTYLFDLVDRFEDPDLNRVEAHFGLLRVDGTPKPAFGSVARLMAELRDARGEVATQTAPIGIRVRGGVPSDLRIVALRRSDRSTVLAIWRERSLWDTATRTALAMPTARLHLDLNETYVTARIRSLAGGRTSWQLPIFGGLDLNIRDDVTIVRLGLRLR